ncbi:hypothetical protein ABZT49_11260 [Methylobacterium sp. EM32]|uniref:hypothetical protein n=1 Tax=Methylobacterium sp. EM32 TaxID=3163481 RepID=UPI0033A941F7
MSTSSTLRERLGLPAETPTDRPAPSGILAAAEFHPLGPITEPVSLARVLRELGLDLSQAHGIVTELVAGRAAGAAGILDLRADVLSSIVRLGALVVLQVGKTDTYEVYRLKEISHPVKILS